MTCERYQRLGVQQLALALLDGGSQRRPPLRQRPLDERLAVQVQAVERVQAHLWPRACTTRSTLMHIRQMLLPSGPATVTDARRHRMS